MRNNIIKVPKSLEFSITEIYREPFIKNENMGTLSTVLNSNLDIPRIEEIIKGIEGVELSTKDVEKMEYPEFQPEGEEDYKYIPFTEWEDGYMDLDKIDISSGGKEPYVWIGGNLPHWAYSYKDLTFVGLDGDSKPNEYEVYKTSEVLEVLKQWLAYLKKFEAEKKEKEEKKKKWKFWKK